MVFRNSAAKDLRFRSFEIREGFWENDDDEIVLVVLIGLGIQKARFGCRP